MTKKLGISEVLDSLKKEFSDIEKASEGKEGKYGFDVESIVLEIQFTATKVGKGGVNFAVVQAGGEYSKEEVQKITLELSPYVIDKELKFNPQKSDYENFKIRGEYDQPIKRPISFKKASKRKPITLKRKAHRR